MTRILAAALATALLASCGGEAPAADTGTASPAIVVTTKAELDKTLSANQGTVLLDFHATWCGPCKELAKQIDAVTKAHPGEVTVVKVDVDQAPALAAAYQVEPIPHLVLFKGGKQVASKVGYLTSAELTSWLGLK